MPKILRISCSWCNIMNAVGDDLEQGLPIYCVRCKHRADRLRRDCDCLRCADTEKAVQMWVRESQAQRRNLKNVRRD